MRRLIPFCLLLAACQGYSPEPLDDTVHEAAWRGRDPAQPLAADYARRLAAGEPAPARWSLDDGVSLPEAEIIALFFHPELRRIRAEAGIALAGAEETGHWDDPELEVSAQRVLASVSNPWVLGGGIKFTLPLSGRLGVAEDKAWAEHRLALTQVVQAEWQSVCNLRQTWIEAAAMSEELVLLSALVSGLAGLKESADKLTAAGALSRLDARLIELELAARRVEAYGLQTALADAQLRLREHMGLHPDAPLELVLARPEIAAPAEGTQELLRKRNPALRAERARYAVSEQSLRLEIRKQYPDLVIGGGYELEDGQSHIGIGLGLPIPIINLNKEGIARARAARVEARAAYESALERASHALARAQSGAERARGHLALVLETLVPPADAQAREAMRLAELGEFDALRQLDVLTRQHNARLALLRADTQLRQSQAEVLKATGPQWTEVKEDRE